MKHATVRSIVRAETGIDQAPVKQIGFPRAIEHEGVFFYARRTEIVAQAADSDDQRVIANLALWQYFNAVLFANGRNFYFVRRAVESFKATERKAEVVPPRLGKIVELMRVNIHAAGSDFMQQRLPEMGTIAVDQGDRGQTAPAKRIAQPGGQFQATCASTDNDDTMHDVCDSQAL